MAIPILQDLNVRGEVAANSLDISGNVDIDGTLETDALTIGSSAISLNHLSDILIENNSIWIGSDPSSTTNTAEYNVGVGKTALDAITSGDHNTTVGYGAGGALTTGGSHVAIGKNALAVQTDSGGIVAIGSGAFASMTDTSPAYMVGIGMDALGGTDGSQLGYNVAIGYASQKYAESSGNVSIGANTLIGSASTAMDGEHNTAIGHSALTAVTDGDDNTVVGYLSGNTITTGQRNTYVGSNITASAVNVDNEIVIGQAVTGKGSNTVLLGNASTTAWLPADDNGVDLGSAALSFKDSWIQGTLTVGTVTATNVGGTLSTAAQTNITSLGTLTTLTVDNVIINGTTIGHTGDTDLLTLTSGNLTIAGDADVTGELNFQKSGFTAISVSTNTYTVDFSQQTNNYSLTAKSGTNILAFSNLGAAVVGKSGSIVITNPASGTPSWSPLPGSAYTPGGGEIVFNTTANKIALINYFVVASDKVLINYVGNFGIYPQP